jgi:hypothetical protein
VITITPSSVSQARLDLASGQHYGRGAVLIHDRDTWHTVSEIGAANPRWWPTPL